MHTHTHTHTHGAAGDVAGGENREEEEEEEEDLIWGPLKHPVDVKLADLGNACWVVSAYNSNNDIQSLLHSAVAVLIHVPRF